jgi:hypothetical protein
MTKNVYENEVFRETVVTDKPTPKKPGAAQLVVGMER